MLHGMRTLSSCAALVLLVSACKDAPPPPPEAQLSTDLPEQTIAIILSNVARQGGPRGERIAGLGLGSSALPPPARPLADGGMPPPPEPTTAKAPANGGDLRWDLEPYGAIAAAAKGELLELPAAGADVPDLWRDPGGTWVAIGGRAQVLLIGSQPLGAHEPPQRFTALTEPWLKGQVALTAPTSGAALAHFAALYQAWGEERMNAWLDGLKKNEVQVLPSDAAVREAVVTGKAIVGLMGSDEAAKAAASAAKVQVVYPNQHSIGTFVWPTALSRPRNPAHPEAAQALAEKLADPAVEQLLVAREPGFLPLRAGIPVPPGVRSATGLVVVSVNPAKIVEEINLRRDALKAWADSATKK
ncbi:MAG: extracellular solute-binding protein [Deltaproteobacteria bacterium]|nr:extracellular solute-binding protein [Deltaproteobacteria bacterium]